MDHFCNSFFAERACAFDLQPIADTWQTEHMLAAVDLGIDLDVDLLKTYYARYLLFSCAEVAH